MLNFNTFLYILVFSFFFIPTIHIILLNLFDKLLSKKIILLILIILPNIFGYYIFKENLVNYPDIISLFLYNSTIFLIYFEMYVFLERGFALSILISINEEKKIFFKQLILRYGKGKGYNGLINKRLRTLKEYNLIQFNKINEISITKKMLIIYYLLSFTCKVLNIKFKG